MTTSDLALLARRELRGEMIAIRGRLESMLSQLDNLIERADRLEHEYDTGDDFPDEDEHRKVVRHTACRLRSAHARLIDLNAHLDAATWRCSSTSWGRGQPTPGDAGA